MSKTYLLVPDQHAHPDHGNERADWLAQFIIDLKPDVLVNLGDAADLASLSSYDKGKRSFVGKSYARDLDSHLDFQERMWLPVKKTKKRLPYSVFLEGNHEHRIERALDASPELQGTIGFSDFQFDEYYDEVVRYDGGTPGIIKLGGIHFAHYFVSGDMGRPISGEHHAYSLIAKKLCSSVQGHSHKTDYCIRPRQDGTRVQALVCGVYQDYKSDWAGKINDLWWRGLIVLRNVEGGSFDPEWISIERLKEAYG